MANPNPQHNPTDGLGVAAYVQVTGTNISNRANGGLTVGTEATANDTTGLNGQGYGAVASTNHPVAQYELQLSLSGKTIGGKAYASTCQLTTVLKDVANTTYSGTSSEVIYRSANNPSAGSPAWYRSSNFAGYAADIASVSSTGLITALAKGQAIIEVAYPTFDVDSDQVLAAYQNVTNVEADYIYCQIVVNVVA